MGMHVILWRFLSRDIKLIRKDLQPSGVVAMPASYGKNAAANTQVIEPLSRARLPSRVHS